MNLYKMNAKAKGIAKNNVLGALGLVRRDKHESMLQHKHRIHQHPQLHIPYSIFETKNILRVPYDDHIA